MLPFAEIIRTMPLLSEPGMLEEMVQKLTLGNLVWESPGLHGLVQLGLAVALTVIQPSSYLCAMQNIPEANEILERALSNKAFHFCVDVVLKTESLHREEFYMRYFHTLISDLILLMPLKIKELRNRAEESMRLIQAYQQQGIEPPMNLDDHFKYLMLMVGELYEYDPLNCNLGLDYWCQQSTTSHLSNSIHSKLASRQVALFKFVRLAGEILLPGLVVPYLKMIASLASSPQGARQAFNFLKPNGMNHVET